MRRPAPRPSRHAFPLPAWLADAPVPVFAADLPAAKPREIAVTRTPSSRQRFTTPVDVAVPSGSTSARPQRPSPDRTLEPSAGARSFAPGALVRKPVIRGLSGNRIRALSNRIGLDFQQSGIRHAPEVDPRLTDRTDIVRGPSSVLCGSGAIGGAADVIHEFPIRVEPDRVEPARTPKSGSPCHPGATGA
jgi:iron complex outermembrane receptor protein/hemoglobin/transferrin/lactoferrin receptor protein